jgi:hypothetical protein
MRYKFLMIVIAGVLLSLYACKKDNMPATIVARWNIVSDSTYAGVGLENHPVNYLGKPADYFDVRSNGYIYSSENGILDTLHYSLGPQNKIVIGNILTNINEANTSATVISDLTSHSAIITSPRLLSPGGIYFRKLTLRR